jgi:membrane protease YdiL (CAAX protease family)
MSVVKTSTSEHSPLSPKDWPADAFVWWRSLLFGVALCLALFVPELIIAIVLFLTHVLNAHDLQSLSWPVIGFQLISYAFGLLFLTMGLPRLAHRSLAELGLRAPLVRDIGWGIVGAVAMILVAGAAGALEDSLLHLKPDEVQVHWLREARGSLVGGFVFLACIAAPFFEELTFRGFLFNALLRYVPAWAAVVLSACIFGGVHWQPGNAGALLPLAAAGIVLAVVYYRSGSLAASMITHGCFNLFTVVAVLSFHQN